MIQRNSSSDPTQIQGAQKVKVEQNEPLHLWNTNVLYLLFYLTFAILLIVYL